MPTYTWKCDSPGCDRRAELFERISERSHPSCPDGHGPMRSVLSASTFVLRGGGWYADGYQKKSGGRSGNDK